MRPTPSKLEAAKRTVERAIRSLSRIRFLRTTAGAQAEVRRLTDEAMARIQDLTVTAQADRITRLREGLGKRFNLRSDAGPLPGPRLRSLFDRLTAIEKLQRKPLA